MIHTKWCIGQRRGNYMIAKDEVIILTKMYVGEYLEENIGHEVINLFKSDNGNNYIYVNKDGRINNRYDDKVRAVLLVKHVEKGVMEIVAKAEELEQVMYKKSSSEEESAQQVAYVDENRVTYGGVPIYQVHNDTIEEKKTITFKTNKLRLVKKPIYLIEEQEKMDCYDGAIFLPEKHFSSQSLKMYYTPVAQPDDCEILEDVLNDDSLWESDNTTERIDVTDKSIDKRRTFLNIIRKDYDELAYSNLLAFFFEENRQLFVGFTKEVLGIEGFTKNFKIIRESNNHIDLWIEDSNNIIVIENKIKSKINGERHDIYSEKIQSQLKEYYEYTMEKREGKNTYFYIFSPNYNYINLSKYESGEKYSIVNYSQIYDFYLKNAGSMLHINYFREFIDALELHSKTVDNSNFEIMKDRFISKIRRIQGN